MKDQATSLIKSAKKFTAVSVQNKTNGPLVRVPHFQNKIGWGEGGFAIFTKSSITSTKADDSLVRKYNKKATFLNKNILQLKENTAIHPMVQNLFPNVKVSNFPLAGPLQYFVKHCGKLTKSLKF